MRKDRETLHQIKWEVYKELVLQKFCPIHEVNYVQTKFLKYKMDTIKLMDYDTKFS